MTSTRTGLSIGTHFSKNAEDLDSVFGQIKWKKVDARITDSKGKIVFEQRDVEAPEFWSQQAINIVASKYFRGHLGTPGRETSVRQLVGRVVTSIARWGEQDGYFASATSTNQFTHELAFMLLNQMFAFNSPVWFNVGVDAKPQSSACFINSVNDTMESILELAKTEARLFKGGSGAGSNLSAIRASSEKLSGGGTASGPISFMKGFDAFAGVIKSGGKTRRSAKLVCLDVDHPDILDFIDCKLREEKKAWALIDAGYDGAIDGEAYGSVFFQNANHSIRVTDTFMANAANSAPWQTKWRTTGNVAETLNARDVLMRAAQAATICGDPGIQYDTTINSWHTCPNTARIKASNPCSEYMFLDDSACNLGSLNLMRFRQVDGDFDIEAFAHAVTVAIVAQEILVGNSSYPTLAIEANSHRFRPLGLGYANLGALLMASGLAYDSDEGRSFAGAITSLMGAVAYQTSALIAKKCGGPFDGFAENREPFLDVIKRHFDASKDHVDRRNAVNGALKGTISNIVGRVWNRADLWWANALETGSRYGYRNAQVTVLAPTGTIAFMMDCDTTGIEPDIALVKYKHLVGGGMMKIVNQTVPLALERLGYEEHARLGILAHIEMTGTIEGSDILEDDLHLPVFDCAFKPADGTRTIQPMGHVRMMAACQPFLSGAISKTVNMPESATAQDIFDVYMEGWKLGLKAIAVYRDGSKRSQPLSTGTKTVTDAKTPETAKSATNAKSAMNNENAAPVAAQAPTPKRRKLPSERQALTHKFSIAGHEGYVTVGLYEDGTPGEIFITMSKEGSTISGLMDTLATTVSTALQYGVPIQVLVNKFSHVRFEPSGFTGNKELPQAKSIVDYIFRWVELRFLPKTTDSSEPAVMDVSPDNAAASAPAAPSAAQNDAPACMSCGSITVRNGSCYACANCGATTGCG